MLVGPDKKILVPRSRCTSASNLRATKNAQNGYITNRYIIGMKKVEPIIDWKLLSFFQKKGNKERMGKLDFLSIGQGVFLQLEPESAVVASSVWLATLFLPPPFILSFKFEISLSQSNGREKKKKKKKDQWIGVGEQLLYCTSTRPRILPF